MLKGKNKKEKREVEDIYIVMSRSKNSVHIRVYPQFIRCKDKGKEAGDSMNHLNITIYQVYSRLNGAILRRTLSIYYRISILTNLSYNILMYNLYL